MRLLAAVLLGGLIVSPAAADVEKLAVPTEKGLCFYWWPRLPALAGWHHDREQSFHISANALAPDGSTFADAETVIYAKAIYKPRQPETKSVEQLIENDKKEFATHSPTVAVREADTLTTGDGRKLRSLSFVPTAEGNWERVSYGEEGDFYLIFTISSRSRAGYDSSMAAYERLIRGYRELLQPSDAPQPAARAD